MTPEQRIDQAERVQRLMNDELILGAWEALEAEYIKIWKNAKTPEAREDAHRYVSLIPKFKHHLHTIVGAGALAKAQVKEIEGRKIWPL